MSFSIITWSSWSYQTQSLRRLWYYIWQTSIKTELKRLILNILRYVILPFRKKGFQTSDKWRHKWSYHFRLCPVVCVVKKIHNPNFQILLEGYGNGDAQTDRSSIRKSYHVMLVFTETIRILLNVRTYLAECKSRLIEQVRWLYPGVRPDNWVHLYASFHWNSKQRTPHVGISFQTKCNSALWRNQSLKNRACVFLFF